MCIAGNGVSHGGGRFEVLAPPFRFPICFSKLSLLRRFAKRSDSGGGRHVRRRDGERQRVRHCLCGLLWPVACIQVCMRVEACIRAFISGLQIPLWTVLPSIDRYTNSKFPGRVEMFVEAKNTRVLLFVFYDEATQNHIFASNEPHEKSKLLLAHKRSECALMIQNVPCGQRCFPRRE